MIERLRRLLARLTALPAWLRWMAVAGWAGLLWWASARPSRDKAPSFSGGLLWNGGHVVAYFVLGGLAFAALHEATSSPRRRAVAAAVLAAAYGVVDEWHQSHVPGRDASLFDVASDALGAVLAVVGLLWLRGEVRGRWVVALLPLCLASAVLATVWPA